MSDKSIDALLEDLKHSDPSVRQQATEQLWRLWFEQKGLLGLEVLRQAQILIDKGEIAKAEEVLTKLIRHQPDFAEAWNRRAVLYYLQQQYETAIADCNQVLQLNPVHFGALHGLGICYAALGEFSLAIQAFQRALEIVPYSLENQRFLLECMARLS